MTLPKFVEMIGLVSATAMPFWNIPLIIRIWRRKSSKDISMAWVIGVWICVMGMLPSSIVSNDMVLKTFGIINAVLFSLVFITVFKFHGNSKPVESDSTTKEHENV